MDSQSNEPIRTRSRSKTPGLSLRVSADKDVNGDTVGRSDKKSKKAPNVTTIEEELNSTKKSLAADGGAGARSIRQTRTVTSDYSSDGVSPDKGTFKQSSKSITITMSNSATSSSLMKTTQQLSSSAPDKKEVRQNEINRVLENTQAAILRTSTPKAASKGQKTVTLTPEELKQHAAYKEYKEAGEYWNKFPKTDYTYSELSPHRREIVPGVVAMPNMSRPGLSKHTERINVMIQRNPTQETYIRQRYASSNYSSAGISGGNFAHVDPYDSGDEQLDFSRVSKSNSHRNSYWKSSATSSQVQLEHRSIINRFFLAMVNLFYSSAHAISRTFNRSEHNLYYTRIEDERSFIIKVYSFFASLTTNIFKKIYLLISSVLFLDTWLLQTASSDVQQGRRKRKFLLLLLILLPFLLFGAYLLADEDQTIVLPASRRASFALSSLSNVLPAISGDDLDNFRVNLFQKLDWRESSFSWRSLLPTFSLSFWSSSGPDAQYEKLRSNLKNTLSREEYDNLMQHIDTYIEGLLTEKYLQKEQQEAKGKQSVSPEVTLHIASLVQQNLKEFSYTLSQADVDRIAEKVRIELLASFPNVFSRDTTEDERSKREAKVQVTKETLIELQRLIKQEISITNNNFVISEQQLEDILVKILSSRKLEELIDSRILRQTKDFKTQHETQAALIENLKNEITEIKTHFTEKLIASSLMVEDNMKSLRDNQDRLADRVQSYRIENDEKYVQLLASIDERLAAAQQEQFAGLNSVIKKNIVTIMGLNVQEDFTDEDLKTWISNLFVAKDYLENRLKEYQVGVSALIQQEMERSAATLMKEISEKIQKEVLASIQSFKNEVNIDAKAGGMQTENTDGVDGGGGGLTEDHVRRIVREALRIYDADKTGLVDYALESAGGQILSTRCTESYQTHSAQISIFGIPLWYPTNTPRTVISPTMQPGQCWAFSGFPGYLVIQLNSNVIVTGFSLEHISKLLAPNGQIDSAPKNFSVWGLGNENDPHPILLGNYVYEDNGAPLQYFPVDNPNRQELRGRAFRIVELRIESNHGNENYTCLYRFRVHGERL
ncbi:klaroid protein [Malaya genurostris]|uniref:klaroid protein n=1 Tax=Malaya genurostris TaxID=325434 RepID=UPI0026F3CACA|nr:klaroid protein [Malaya genurostris]XP_058457894.1 klaroid protein [Malaya genurostris]XP_058457895.1 klaroid protein [Malaya genurostris]